MDAVFPVYANPYEALIWGHQPPRVPEPIVLDLSLPFYTFGVLLVLVILFGIYLMVRDFVSRRTPKE